MKKASEKSFWIIWNPESHLPPTVKFETKAEALEVARGMADNFYPDRFYVCEAESCVEGHVRPLTTTDLK